MHFSVLVASHTPEEAMNNFIEYNYSFYDAEFYIKNNNIEISVDEIQDILLPLSELFNNGITIKYNKYDKRYICNIQLVENDMPVNVENVKSDIYVVKTILNSKNLLMDDIKLINSLYIANNYYDNDGEDDCVFRNSDGYCDWFELGGKYSGLLALKTVKSKVCDDYAGFILNKTEKKNSNFTDRAKKRDIDWKKTREHYKLVYKNDFSTYHVLIDDYWSWIEGDLEQFDDLLDSIDDNMTISIYDCHS